MFQKQGFQLFLSCSPKKKERKYIQPIKRKSEKLLMIGLFWISIKNRSLQLWAFGPHPNKTPLDKMLWIRCLDKMLLVIQKQGFSIVSLLFSKKREKIYPTNKKKI